MDASSFPSLRQLPYSAEAEMSVLGAILLDSGVIADVAVILNPDDFYIKANGEIYDAMIEMFNLSRPIDLITLIKQLEMRGTYEEIGANAYLARLIEMVPGISNIVEYAKIVEGKSNLRKLISGSSEITRMAMSGEGSDDVIDRSEQIIYSIAEERNFRGLYPIKDVMLTEYDRLHKLSIDKNAMLGVSTGFRDLDRHLIGLNNSDLVIIAARPGMGKTSFVLNLAKNVAVNTHKAVAIFSLEMSKEQLVNRMLSFSAMVDNYRLRTGELSDEDWINLARSASMLSNEKIFIDDTSTIKVTDIKAKCRRVKDLGLVVIDYLQLMSSSGKNENRVQEISDISRSLKIMAKELNVPVICLSQLSRGPESRTDKRPMLSDLRESGAIEQDADVVLFLYRDDYYDENTEKRNIAECIIAKNRHGSTGKCEMLWLGEYTLFSTLEKNYDD